MCGLFPAAVGHSTGTALLRPRPEKGELLLALFKRNYDKPGPGVPKNAPRKKGIARFFEILGRDFFNLVKLNLLYQLFLLPTQVFTIMAFMIYATSLTTYLPGAGLVMLVLLGLAIIGGILVGPATVAMTHAVSKMMRDDPGFIWNDFKKVFKENFKSTIIPGMLYVLIMVAEIFAFLYYFAMSSTSTGNFVMLIVFIFSLLVFSMTMPYFFLQKGYLNLNNRGTMKNSLLLAFGFAPRSFVGGVVNTLLMAVQIYFIGPVSLITIFIGYTIPTLFTLMWIWPPVNKTFKIEKTLRIREGLEEGEDEAEALAAEEEKERQEKEAKEAEDGVEGWEDLEIPKRPQVGTSSDK